MLLDRLTVAPEVHALRDDFAVLALAVTGAGNGPGDAQSEARLVEAEAWAAAAPELPSHVEAWRECYRAFGAKPQRTASSVDALWKRARAGALPRINWLVDLYNAVSVRHVLPVGGEDLDRFVGPIRLIRAAGTEAFDTTEGGRAVVDRPLLGEVVWADDLGVTCRRWNWRQGTRTRLTEQSTGILFLLERLEPMPLPALEAAADALVDAVTARFPQAAIERRRFGPGAAPVQP